MKKNKFTLLALLTLCSITVFGPAARAEDAPKTDKPHHRAGPGGARGEHMKRVAEELKLTDEQKGKLKAILQDQGQKMRALREDNDLSREQKAAKFKELREATQGKIKALLTDEQWKKWQKLNERPQHDRPGHHPPKDGDAQK